MVKHKYSLSNAKTYCINSFVTTALLQSLLNQHNSSQSTETLSPSSLCGKARGEQEIPNSAPGEDLTNTSAGYAAAPAPCHQGQSRSKQESCSRGKAQQTVLHQYQPGELGMGWLACHGQPLLLTLSSPAGTHKSAAGAAVLTSWFPCTFANVKQHFTLNLAPSRLFPLSFQLHPPGCILMNQDLHSAPNPFKTISEVLHVFCLGVQGCNTHPLLDSIRE